MKSPRLPWFLLTTCSALLMGGVSHAQPMDDALAKLLSSHPQVKAAQQNIHASEAGKTEAFSGYLPKVAVSGGIGKENLDKSGQDPAGLDTRLSPNNIGATVTQNVFNGFRTTSDVRSADTNTDIAKTTLDQTGQQVLFEGINAYLDVLRQAELGELALENQDNLKSQLHLEDERVNRGSGIAVDVLQAKSRLQIARERHTAFSGGLRDAVSRYTQVFGEPPVQEHMAIPTLPMATVPKTLGEATAIALQENPGLINSGRNVRLADIGRTSARSGFFPSVDVVAAARHDNDLQGVRGDQEDYTLTLQASWEIFSGFADAARVKRAAHAHEASMETNAHTQRKVVEEVRLAWSSVETNRERMELLDNAVNIASEVHGARKKLRDAGKESAINVLDAENELYRAKIDAAAAKYDYYSSVYRLLLSIGRLHPETVKGV
ncbi:MAG: TolC family outer membrane protein [Alphaproteobacteria bacterium]|nr:TolC family outer membrane protein [Alphaproteobacteria bacterium]